MDLPAIPKRLDPARHIPPKPEDVTEYSASIGYPMDGQKWCDAYAEKGWKVGKSGKQMVDWHAAVRNWKNNGYGRGTITLHGQKPNSTDYTRI